jgi:large subunit ribosomal protein L35Ae
MSARAPAEKRYPERLYVKGTVSSFRRSQMNQDNHTSILVLEGVKDKAASSFYMGKRVVYIYKAPTKKNASRFRSIWGRISRPHGTNGAVRAKFRVNLPAKSLGGPVHVMLYPSQV